jgi:tetratricopeptide (TPR) repeat protein
MRQRARLAGERRLLMSLFKNASLAFVGILLPCIASSAFAQPELPRPSPNAKVSQVIGLTEIAVEYSSPAAKGRTIWGGLVPYDQMWRTGANQATKIAFSRDVTFGGKAVPAGTYALFTIPTKGAWTVILNKKADQAGTGRDYHAELDLARFQIHPKAAPHRERLTFLFSDFTDDQGMLDLEWDKLRLSIPIKVATQEQAMATIAKGIDGAWRTYANAARYLAETKKDYDTALGYIDQSLSLKEDWFNLWIKATILAGKGKLKDAISFGDKAYQLGQKAELFFLEPEIKKTLAEWKKKG